MQVECPARVGLHVEEGPVLLFLGLEAGEVLQLELCQVEVGLGVAGGRALALGTEQT